MYQETLRPDRAPRPLTFTQELRCHTCYTFVLPRVTYIAMSFTLGIDTAVGGSLYLHSHRTFCSPANGHRWKTPAWCVRRSVPSVTMTFLFQAVLQNTRGCVKILRRFQEGCEVERFEPRFEGFQRQKFEVVEGLRRFARFCKGFWGFGRSGSVWEVSAWQVEGFERDLEASTLESFGKFERRFWRVGDKVLQVFGRFWRMETLYFFFFFDK